MKARRLLAVVGALFAVTSIVWVQLAVFGAKDRAGHADGRWIFEALTFAILSGICFAVRDAVR